MNYTKQERHKVYLDKSSLDGFDVDREGSIEKLMLERMYEEPHIYDLPEADKYMLEIFNTAHYITTMILADPRPMTHFRFYMDTSLRIGAAPDAERNTYGRYFSAMALAMVVNYLKICDDKYYNGNDILPQKIWDWHKQHYRDGDWDADARFTFFNNVRYNSDIDTARQFMSREDFLPLPVKVGILHSTIEELKNDIASEEDIAALFEEGEEPQAVEGAEKLLARIKELEAENAKLKAELSGFQGKTGDIEEDVKEGDHVLYNKVCHEFFVRLLEKAGFDINDTGNKTAVGELWRMITGKSADEIRKYCSRRQYRNSRTHEDIKRLNDKLAEMGLSEMGLR